MNEGELMEEFEEEDKIMAQIFILNERIEDLCFERDEWITKLNKLRDEKKESEQQ